MIEVKYRSTSGEWLCFNHAVYRIMKKHQIINPVVDEFGDEYDPRDTRCVECSPEPRVLRKVKVMREMNKL